MLNVENLFFEYPGFLALKDVSFSVARGSITALVGPNGAGKTTLLRCIAALDEPLSGSINFGGLDVHEHPRKCHRDIGYLSDFFGLYDDLSVEQCLKYMSMAHGLPPETHDEAIRLAAVRVGIHDRMGDKAGSLSRGLRQRLAIGQAIIHRPKLVLLDEPASGLDPEARASLSELFLTLRDDGMTLIVSSHIIAELEEYSTDMLILKEGRVVAERRLGHHFESSVLMAVSLGGDAEGFAEALAGNESVTDVRVDGRHARFRFRGDEADRAELLSYLVGLGLPVCSFGEIRADMQQEYMSVVREGAAVTEGGLS